MFHKIIEVQVGKKEITKYVKKKIQNTFASTMASSIIHIHTYEFKHIHILIFKIIPLCICLCVFTFVPLYIRNNISREIFIKDFHKSLSC